MQHFLFPAPLPPPLPPPPPGRGTILSQEARLHALQIAEEIQAERGSYRKWNEVAKAVNRQYGSNVDGDLVKRQVTSMLRSVQRSGVNSVKRPRKHAEVIQQLLDPVAKRQQGPDGQILRIEGSVEDDDDEREEDERIHSEEAGEPASNNSETTPPHSPKNTTTTESPTSSSTSTSTSADSSPAVATTANTSTTTTTTSSSSDPSVKLPSSTSTSTSEPDTNSKPEPKAPESHSIERVSKPRKTAEPKISQHTLPHPSLVPIQAPLPPQGIFSTAPPPPLRILPNMSVDEGIHSDIDAEFIKTQEIDGSAFQTLSHKELTDFGVPTFGKRNKLLQLCISFDSPNATPPAPVPQDFYFGRLPPAFPGPFMDPKAEQMGGDKDSKDGGEKKPPVTKIIDLEVVGVRKRYLVERENGAIEVLTPCKLRKYKNLTSAFEHIHPDKLVPIPTFSTSFTHVPNSEDSSKSSESSSSSSTPSSSSPASPTRNSKNSKSSKSASATTYMPPSGYYPVFYSSTSYPVMSPSPSSSMSSSNLQWIHSPYPGLSSQRTPEKYHSFHPYHPPK